MMFTKLLVAIITLGLGAGCAQADELNEKRKQQLDHLLIQDCGSCHGLRMTGGLGPAITPTQLESRSVEVLTDIILLGVPNTAMPPWNELLTREEAIYLAKQLKNK